MRIIVATVVLSGCVQQMEMPDASLPLTDPSASILLYIDGHSMCTAVAIDEHTALTARHCIRGNGILAYGDTEKDRVTYELESVRTYQDRDLARLRISEPLLHDTVQVATMPVERGQLLMIWGYGCGEDDAWHPPEARPALAMDHDWARAMTCHGDSGGAVISSDGLAGIVWGVGPDTTKFATLSDINPYE